MHVEFLVEEPSTEAALDNLLPRMLPADVTFRLHNFQSKLTLLTQLPNRMKGYKHWLPADWRIVVLIDEDRENCDQLKTKLEQAAGSAGLVTKSSASGQISFQVLNRIAVEELEAWFFGDVVAVVTAYPRVPLSLGKKEKYRDPDTIKGGTWEALERELQYYGYYSAGLPKIEVARNISKHMIPERNRSNSFRCFKNGIEALIAA
ncbi:MAG TPA: DUF4276 family protein [Blastocatellia bacterium]|nr:DUF4276 family protein [Blastocatellia bacterium]